LFKSLGSKHKLFEWEIGAPEKKRAKQEGKGQKRRPQSSKNPTAEAEAAYKPALRISPASTSWWTVRKSREEEPSSSR
jgi:hypothetical protein